MLVLDPVKAPVVRRVFRPLHSRAARHAHEAPAAAALAAIADQLESVIAEAEPQKAKALLRLLIDELRVNSCAEILSTYRLITPRGLRNVRKSGGGGNRTRVRGRTG